MSAISGLTFSGIVSVIDALPKYNFLSDMVTDDFSVDVAEKLYENGEITQDDINEEIAEIVSKNQFSPNVEWDKIKKSKWFFAKHISVNHDYIFVYAKNIDLLKFNLLDRTEEMNNRYKNPDNDPRGPWQSGDLVANEIRTNGNYNVVGPTGKVFNVPEGKHWVYSEDNMRTLIAENRIWFGKGGTSFPRKKRYLTEVQQGRTPDSWWTSSEVGHNQEGARELKAIFDGNNVFTNPKPTRLIERIIKMGSKGNSIILDFFAGSGTTGHAVLKYNAEHEKQVSIKYSFILFNIA